MELNKTRKWFYIFTGISTTFILLLGAWWLFLVFKLADKLNKSAIPNLEGNLISMVKWEGFTFFILLLSLACALLYFFYQDHKKTKSLHSFFASLTHELKTPLASIRLQSQVMDENLDDSDINLDQKKSLKKYSQRLLQDTIRLEDQLDKHLQLSRLEKDDYLQLEDINIQNLFLNEFKRNNIDSFEFLDFDNSNIKANAFTVSLIIKNLIENTLRHSPKSEKIVIEAKSNAKFLEITYNDFGRSFTGEYSQLGKLFYKSNSPKGSGIGLYLIKKLMLKNQGKFKIIKDNNLIFKLSFLKGSNEES